MNGLGDCSWSSPVRSNKFRESRGLLKGTAASPPRLPPEVGEVVNNAVKGESLLTSGPIEEMEGVVLGNKGKAKEYYVQQGNNKPQPPN